MASKFFRFSIVGDNVDPEQIKATVELPCGVFHKDEISVKKYITERIIKQKTNRWVYSDETFGKSRLDYFLTKNLRVLVNNLSDLSQYIKKYDCVMELIVYAGDKTDIKLNAEQVDLISQIGVGINISFC